MIGNIVGKVGSPITSTTTSTQDLNIDQNRLALFRAVEAGDEQKTQDLLDAAPELIHAKTKTRNNSLLHIAVGNGHESICRFLLEKGHESNPVNNRGETPYNYAKTADTKQLLLKHHVDTLIEKFFTFNKERKLTVMLMDRENLVRYCWKAFDWDIRGKILFLLSSNELHLYAKSIKDLAPVITTARSDILMTPYFGELMVILENERQRQCSNLSDFFIESEASFSDRFDTAKSKTRQAITSTRAHLMAVSRGIELFPFLRDFPQETDRADIAEAKKMFCVFLVNELRGYFFDDCSDEVRDYLKRTLPDCSPTMDFVKSYLPRTRNDVGAEAYDRIYNETHAKYI